MFGFGFGGFEFLFGWLMVVLDALIAEVPGISAFGFV